MATNEILPFAQGVGANVQSQVDYAAEALRDSGNVAGIARSNVNNKALRQASVIAAGVAQFMADNQPNDVTDSLTPAAIATFMEQSVAASVSFSLPTGYFSGLSLANNSGATNTTIDVAPGVARSSDNTVDITLTSTIRGILQSSGAWAAGDNQNKLDTGTKANSTTYHVFTIRKTSDGTGDILFSLSATAPTLPSGYAGFRRVGRAATDGSGNIRQFKARGDGVYDWVTPIIEVTSISVAAGTSVLTLTGMGGAFTECRMNALIVGDSGNIRITPVDVDNPTTGADWTTYTGGTMINAPSPSVNEGIAGECRVAVGPAGTVNLRTYVGSGNVNGARVLTMGWREFL